MGPARRGAGARASWSVAAGADLVSRLPEARSALGRREPAGRRRGGCWLVEKARSAGRGRGVGAPPRKTETQARSSGAQTPEGRKVCVRRACCASVRLTQASVWMGLEEAWSSALWAACSCAPIFAKKNGGPISIFPCNFALRMNVSSKFYFFLNDMTVLKTLSAQSLPGVCKTAGNGASSIKCDADHARFSWHEKWGHRSCAAFSASPGVKC